MSDFLAVVILAVSILMVSAGYKILRKMGYPDWYFILFLIPGLGQFMYIYLACTDWPIERDLASLRFEDRMRKTRQTDDHPAELDD